MPYPTNDDRFAELSVELILEEPFYGHLLASLVRSFSETVAVIGLGVAEAQVMKLYVHPQFWEKITTANRRLGAVKHELLHLVFNHPLEARHFHHKSIFNLAADLVVNQYLSAEQIPEGTIQLEQFAALNWAPHQDVAYYYHRLLAAWQLLQGSTSPQVQQPGEQIAEMLEQTEQDRSHQFWYQEIEALPAASAKMLRHSTQRMLRQAIQRAGAGGMSALPTALRTYLVQQTGLPSRVNWKRVLRLFAASSQKTNIQNTFKKPSRRYGTLPGIKVKRRSRLLVAIDTSASIDLEEIAHFFQEINLIWRSGAEITVVECDTSIRETYVYAGKMPQFVVGRGGTSFDGPLRYANTQKMLDALFYFTDGFGPQPTLGCRVPVLWVITAQGAAVQEGRWPNFPGRVIKMN